MSDPAASPSLETSRIRRLIGVYDASGSLFGEMAYWVGARLGRRHCALCEITHGTFREKAAWRRCRAGLAVPFETVHLDERSAALESVTRGRTPCVAAETDGGLEVLLGPDELESCGGSPETLLSAVEEAASRCGLVFAADPQAVRRPPPRG